MCHPEPVLSGAEVFVCMLRPDKAGLCSRVFSLAPLVIVDVYRLSEGKQFPANPSQDYKTFFTPLASLLQILETLAVFFSPSFS